MSKTGTEVTEVTPELNGKVSKVEEWAGALVIKTPAEYSVALQTVQRIKAIRSNVVEFFKLSKDSAYAAWKAIVANEKSFTDKLDAAEKTAKRVLLAYQEAEEAKRIAEERRLQAIADEKARKEQERLKAQAEKAAADGKGEKAEALLERAETVAPVAIVVESRIQDTAQSVKKTWKARIVDANLVPREWCIPDEKALDAFAKSTKGMKTVAGVEFFEEKSLSIRK